jgi:NADP-dependent 3-hydroxy acid dehydrogenase YdfG
VRTLCKTGAMSKLTGKVVAITGGARGIGLATAKALHEQGAQVVLGDLDAEATRAAAAQVGARAAGTTLDVRDAASFAAFLAFAHEAFGPVDVLVNNAGVMPIGPFLEEDPHTAQRTVDVNLVGCLNGVRSVLPGMVERGAGHIINVASVAGRSPVVGGITYAASKAGVVSITESARVEFRGSGVHFTCVIPSFTNTDLIKGTKGTRFVGTVEPEDVAAAIAKVIAKPKPDVFVPGVIGLIIRTQPLVGRRVRDAIQRFIKADRTFLEVDRGERAAYDQRVVAENDAADRDEVAAP